MMRFILMMGLFAHLNAATPEAKNCELEKILKEFFPENFNHLKIHKLSGGYSETSNYRIDTDLNSFALRLHGQSQDLGNVNREFYMFTEASKVGIAPHVFGISRDGRGILTEFFKDKSMPLEQLKEPKIIKKTAEALQKIHAIPKSSGSTTSISDKYEEIYRSLSSKQSRIDTINLIRCGIKTLKAMGSLPKTIHGELHPRNIFITPQKIQFIDWYEASWDDPFYDLSYFSILNDFGPNEEQILLRYYLGHEPSASEQQRYHLTKMINLAGISLTLDRIANQDFKDGTGKKSLSYYIHIFATEKTDLS